MCGPPLPTSPPGGAHPPPLALVLALQPQAPGQRFHAALVTAGGERQEFGSLNDLVGYLVRLSLPQAPGSGLR
jgi:hypothetical protein